MNKRQIVLDTETTGLSPAEGHRIIEIGCIELVNRRITGRDFHRFLNPEREIDQGAERVHGISRADLQGKPKFADVVGEFLDFVAGAELVIHNADFDVGFIDHELALMGHEKPDLREHADVLDTLSLARELHPGQRNSLDALCKRYEVDASSREVHGALIDADLLAQVYLAMTGGQTALFADAGDRDEAGGVAEAREPVRPADVSFVVRPASAGEAAAHAALLDRMEKAGPCLWRSLGLD